MTKPTSFSTYSYLSEIPAEIGIICPTCKGRNSLPYPEGETFLSSKTYVITCQECSKPFLTSVSATLSIHALSSPVGPDTG